MPYLFFIIFVSIPLFIAETTIGAVTQKTPDRAFFTLSNNSKLWKWIGNATILTGFLISTFYSVVSGWVLNYVIESFRTGLSFESYADSAAHWQTKITSWPWGLQGHSLVALFSIFVLSKGVQRGLGRINSICMPIFFVAIAALFCWSITLPGFYAAINYLTHFQSIPSGMTPHILLIALGHAFFTLSVGQGTLVTYGSYIPSTSSLFSSAVIIAVVDTLISIVVTIILLATLFSESGATFESGPSLLFEALPSFFSNIQGGSIVSPLFFFLVFIAAITSQLSALEPSIRKIESELSWSRKKSAISVITASWFIGIFSSLSISSPDFWLFKSFPFFDIMNGLTTSYMLPLSALAASIIFIKALRQKKIISSSGKPCFDHLPQMAQKYLIWSIYTAPLFIILVFLHAIGLW